MSIIKYPRRIPVNAARAALSTNQTAKPRTVSGLTPLMDHSQIFTTLRHYASRKAGEPFSRRSTPTELERSRNTDQEPKSDHFGAATLTPIAVHMTRRRHQRNLHSNYNGTTLSRMFRWRSPLPFRATHVKSVSAALSYEEIRHILSISKDDPSLRDLHDVLTIILETGLRAGELRELRWADADLDRGRLLVHRPKCGKNQIVLLGPEALRILKSRREHRPESEFVWGSSPRNFLWRITRELRDLCENNGINRITLHGLRRVSIVGLVPHSEASPSTVITAGGRM